MELRARLRSRVAQEIIHTEHSYVNDLHILTSHFVVPLKDRISQSDHAKIFSNLDMLLGLHEQLEMYLQAQESLSPEETTFGSIFLKYVLSFYSAFVLILPLIYLLRLPFLLPSSFSTPFLSWYRKCLIYYRQIL